MAILGTISLMAALALCLYGGLVPHLGVIKNNWNLIRSAQNASILTFFLILLASCILLNALITSDFSIKCHAWNEPIDSLEGYVVVYNVIYILY